jgi:ABC-type transport system involved in multi-copper enzyme maturation permease subunit
MLKALFWKEWRESRLLLAIGLLLMAGISLLLLYFELAISPSAALTTFSFALIGFIALLGARAFSTEEEKLTFMLSKPVKRQTIITMKMANGLFNTLILSLIPGIMIWTVNVHEIVQMRNILNLHHNSLTTDLGYSLPFLWLCYVFSFFMSSIFLNAAISVLIGIFGSGYIAGGSYILLKKFGWLNFHSFILLAFSLVFLFLSYFIFMRREVRR